MMHIGVVDLIVIYSIPLLLAGAFLTVFSAVLFVIVKRDIGNLDVSEDLRYNIQIRKRRLKFSVLLQILLFENGVQAAVLYRLSRYLYLHGPRPLAVMLHRVSRFVTKHDLPPTARIGPGLVLLHTGGVLAPFSHLGSHVHVRPGSGTCGRGMIQLEDDVHTGLLSAAVDGAVVGRNSESAPRSVVVQDVPPDHLAFGVPATNLIPKRPTKLRGVVLDLEGVLLESTGILTDALYAALDRAGVRLSEREKRRREGLPPERVINEFLGAKPDGRERALQDYMTSVRARLGPAGLRLRAGARELVEKIRERRLKSAVIARQPDRLAKEITERLGLAQSLDVVCGADDVLSEWKPQPWIIYRPMLPLRIGVERVIYIGATRLDMRAGIEAAVRVFLVASPDAGSVPGRALVTRFPDLESVLAEFSKPDLPQTF